MAKTPRFRPARWAKQWEWSCSELPPDRQRSCDRVIMALIRQESSSGLRIKPILPEKYYSEARIASGDRIVFRMEGDEIVFVDVVSQGDVDRDGRRPKKPS